jgi:hypothetical protein
MFTVANQGLANPGYDPKVSTDDELLRRTAEIDARLAFMGRVGGSSDAIAQLQAMRAAIDFERRERAFMDWWTIREHNPVVVETDPGLANKEFAVLPETPQPMPSNRPRPTRKDAPAVPVPTRANRPTSNG